MKALPIILIAVGGVVFVVGILGIIFYVDLVTDSPEDIKDMKQDETLTVYGEIADSPDDLDPNGWPDPVSGSPWKRYNYTFKGGGYFYSEYKLDIEVGESYVIDIQYKGVKEGQPEGPALEGKDSVSGTFLYRLPGIGVTLLGLGVAGVGIFLVTMEVKKGKEKTKERKRKGEAVDKQMELLEREIQVALSSTGRKPEIQYQPPPGHPGPGQMPPQQPMPPPMPPRPPMGQMPPPGPQRPPYR